MVSSIYFCRIDILGNKPYLHILLIFLAGLDYTVGPFSVTFEPEANNRQCFNISILADGKIEALEQFTIEVNLPPPDNVLIQPSSPSVVTASIAGTVL